MNLKVPLLVISGSMGSGKTTVLAEVSDLLEEADVAHAALDMDELARIHPQPVEQGDQLTFTSLAALWPIYAAAGAERLVVAWALEDRHELQLYRDAVPGAEPVVCQLEAPIKTMQERVRIREPGMLQAQLVANAAALTERLRLAHTEDFKVDSGEQRSVTDVAREVLSRAGWL